MSYAQRLRDTYLAARKRIIHEIETRIRWGRSYVREQDLLRLIEREMDKLGVDTAAMQGVQVQESFLTGARDAYRAVRGQEAMPSAAYFTGLHKSAIETCVTNAQAYAQITARLIARQAADRVRELGLQSTTSLLTQNLTWKEQAKELLALLEDDGFLTVPWRNGRGRMRMDSYAELVARTTTNEATTTGLLGELDALGEGLVKMTTYSPTCAVCASRQGRVYRTMDYPEGDERNRFPHISQGLPRWPTYKTIHPNCRHRIMPVVWSQKGQEERSDALRHAEDGFATDPRKEQEIAAYEHAQDVKRRRLIDRKQWERYRAVLGEDGMPTFSGFRRMKAAGSEGYADMQSRYRQINRENAIIGSAKMPGGRNHGKYSDASTWKTSSVQRAVQSYAKQVELHKAKIADPAQYDTGWNQKTQVQQEGLLKKWKKDADRNDELRIIMERILKERR